MVRTAEEWTVPRDRLQTRRNASLLGVHVDRISHLVPSTFLKFAQSCWGSMKSGVASSGLVPLDLADSSAHHRVLYFYIGVRVIVFVCVCRNLYQVQGCVIIIIWYGSATRPCWHTTFLHLFQLHNAMNARWSCVCLAADAWLIVVDDDFASVAVGSPQISPIVCASSFVRSTLVSRIRMQFRVFRVWK